MDQVENLFKFIIDLPYYIYLFTSSVITSLYTWLTRSRKRLTSSDIILITGTASGIGKSTVCKLAEMFPEPVYVLWDINQIGLEDTAKKCRKFGARVHTFVVDLSSHQNVLKSAALVRTQVGKLTILWNNAGIVNKQPFLQSDSVKDESVIRVNMLSYMWMIKEFLPDMIKMGGHIISTCSASVLYRTANVCSYVASKHGLHGFLKSLHFEIRQHPAKPNIRFSTIYLGTVKTPMMSGVSWESRYCFRGSVPMDVDEVAEDIIDGILKEKEEIVIPGVYKIFNWLDRYFPTTFVDRFEEYIIKNLTVKFN